jgi:hypothetical protein
MKKYTTPGRKDEFGNLLPNTSLKHIIFSCTDFEEELAMLQMMRQSMGFMIDRTPKCHCKLSDLVVAAENHGIPIKEEVQKFRRDG